MSESTFSDILGIMLFYFLTGQLNQGDEGNGIVGFFGNIHVGFLEGGGGEREAWTQVYILRIMIIVWQNIYFDMFRIQW